MGQQYPQFTTEEDVCHFFESLVERKNLTPAYPLLHYVTLHYLKLEAIGSSLPELVEFYKFLFCDLAHTVSKEEALTTTINKKLLDIARQYESCNHLPELYRLVIGKLQSVPYLLCSIHP